MPRRRYRPQWILPVTLGLVLSGCVTPSTLPPSITPEQVRAEERKQRLLALDHVSEQQHRLDSLAYPLLRAGVPFCGDHATRWPGFRALHAGAFPAEWRDAAREAYGLTDTLQVFAVTPGGPADRAGLRGGDVLVRAGSHVVAPGPAGARALYEWLRASLPDRDTLGVHFRRGPATGTVVLELEPACAYETVVVPGMAINAWADGTGVYVTTAMARFAEDDELAAIVAHELAHNAMGHISASARNATLGALFGLVGDISVLLAGDTLPEESYTGYFMERGALAYSKDFEREADYVGLYILARAGRNLEGALDIFREFAIAEPESSDYGSTHPSHTERILLMEATIREIEAKRAAGEALEPEREGP